MKGSISNIKITSVDDKPTASPKPTASKAVKKPTANKPIANKPAVESKPNASVTAVPPKAIYTKEAENVKLEENKKCNGWPMGKADLAAAIKTIEASGKEADKLEAAKELITSNCLLVSQVKEFSMLFKNEKASWCKIRSCCIENGYKSCADCKKMPLEECKKFNNFIGKVFGFIFKSDRNANIRRIKEIGYDAFAEELQKSGFMTLKRK